MKLRINITSLTQYLMLYFMLNTMSTGYLLTLGNNWPLIGLAASVFVLVWHGRGNHQSILIVVASTIVCIILTRYLVGGIGIFAIYVIVSRILLGYTSVIVDKKNCALRLIRLGSVLNVGSLIYYTIFSFNKSLLPVLLPFEGVAESGAVFLFNPVFTYNAQGINDTVLRNNGIYTEPTLMAIQLLSLIFLLIFLNKKICMTETERKKHLIIAVITLLTTLSTTGIIAFSIAIIIYVLMGDKSVAFKIRVVILIGIFFLIATVEWTLNGQNGIVYEFFLRKTTSINEAGQMVVDLSADTGIARISAIVAALSLIFKYPLGCGYTIYNDHVSKYSLMGVQSAGGGIVNEIAIFGIIPVSVALVYILKGVSKYIDKSAIPIFIVIFFSTTMAESTMYYSIFFTIATIGYVNYNAKDVDI
ncbi:hypothetical protein [Negativibacillus massiliensis]|uniref:hypothetical protein n=1 Tax=Negativibacillus massiliensis TaxID=1871035 RepID=UPI003AF2E1E0